MAGRDLESLQKQYNKAAVAAKGGMPGRGPGGPGRGPGGPRGMGGKPKNMKNTIKRLLGYVAKYKFHLVFVLLCMLCSTGTSLIGGYMLRPIINNAADMTKSVDDRILYLAQILTLLAGIYLVGIVSNYVQARIMRQSVYVTTCLRSCRDFR